MKNILNRVPLKVILLVVISVFLWSNSAKAQKSIFPSLGDSRSGTSGFQFLKINVDARSAGMGNSNIADAFDASSLYFNPALASRVDKSQFYISHTGYFTDVSMNYLSYVHKLKTVSLGGSLMYLDSGEMNETDEFNPLGTGRVFRTIHLAAGVTFSQQLSDLFSYGVSTKYVEEKIEEIKSQSLIFDIGFFYQVGTTGLRFAVGLNNFGLDATPTGETIRPTTDGIVTETNFEDVSPPTMFQIGAAYEAFKNETLDVLVTGQLINPSDNAERYSIGTEITFMDQFFLRTGYEFGLDEYLLPSAGAGFILPLTKYDLMIDYGFSARERLGSIHRFTLKFNL